LVTQDKLAGSAHKCRLENHHPAAAASNATAKAPDMTKTHGPWGSSSQKPRPQSNVTATPMVANHKPDGHARKVFIRSKKMKSKEHEKNYK
jgi:hypothetical protein